MIRCGTRLIYRSLAFSLVLLVVLPPTLQAQDQTSGPSDQENSPYHLALLAYKSGKYDDARTAIDAAEKANPGDFATEILKSRILTEQGDFADGEKLLRGMLANQPASSESLEINLALGDLLLRKHDFENATKFYELALSSKPNDPDLTLKTVYAQVGSSDLISAAKLASQLKPFDTTADPLDPKHPGNPAYYFAKAALAQATGKGQEADDDIETARTLYGIITTNHYLKIYLQVFDSSQKDATPASRAEPPPTNPPPAP